MIVAAPKRKTDGAAVPGQSPAPYTSPIDRREITLPPPILTSAILAIRRQPTVLAAPRSHVVTGEGKMTEFIEVLQQEHRNIESLLRVLERELAAGF